MFPKVDVFVNQSYGIVTNSWQEYFVVAYNIKGIANNMERKYSLIENQV